MAAKETRIVTRLSTADDEWLGSQADALREHGIDVGKSGVVRMLVAHGRRGNVSVLQLIGPQTAIARHMVESFRPVSMPPIAALDEISADDDGIDYGTLSNEELEAIALRKAAQAEAEGRVTPRQPPPETPVGTIRPLQVASRAPGKEWGAVA